MAITPLMPVYPRSPVRPVRGEGVYLYGEQGEKYLDFAAGIAVNLLGHGHPHLTKAIQDQAATLMHVSNLYGSPQGEAFAQRLIDLTFADEWQYFVVPWYKMSQQKGWGSPKVSDIDAKTIMGIQFQVNDKGRNYDIWVDDLQFTGCGG